MGDGYSGFVSIGGGCNLDFIEVAGANFGCGLDIVSVATGKELIMGLFLGMDFGFLVLG